MKSPSPNTARSNTQHQQNHLLLSDYHTKVEIGAFEEERAQQQGLIFNIAVALNEPPQVASDRVDDILSYDELIYAINNCLQAKRYNLLETLGEDICQHILAHPSAASVNLRIEKPDRVAGRFGVELHRSAQPQDKIAPTDSGDHAVDIWLCPPRGDISAEFDARVQNSQSMPILCPSIVYGDYSGRYGQRRILYAQAQAACELAQRWPHLRLSRTMAELRHSLHLKQAQIWLPVDMVLAAANPPKVAPDGVALARWLAENFDNARLRLGDGNDV